MLLCGDIGGTNTTLALFPADGAGPPRRLAAYASADAPGLEHFVERFLGMEAEGIEAACFAVAGPVARDRVATTNLPWLVEAVSLSTGLGGAPVFLLNDLEAIAWGVAGLAADEVAVLNAGRAAVAGNAAVIAAGTGLGEAGLVWDGARHLPFATEGGHADFAPRSEREMRLLRYLQNRWDHVSWERVLSGPGLVHLLEFLRDVEGHRDADQVLAGVGERDRPAAVSAAALERGIPSARAALELFASLYGAEAGNLALKMKATGGVYLAGGIAPKILPALTDGTFRAAFVAKGRFAGFLADVPVRVILAPHVGLRGAAAYLRARRAAPSARPA